MPYISVTCNTPITMAQQDTLKQTFGHAVKSIGKNEKALMVHFIPDAALYFQGNNSPAAFINVQLLGSAQRSGYEEMTSSITNSVAQTLSIPASHIFMKFEEVTQWGLNGKLF